MYVQLMPNIIIMYNTYTTMYMCLHAVKSCLYIFPLQLVVLLNAQTFTTYWTSLLRLERRRSSV